jgi:uncharacterized protein YutE (UPF0331/DUF86 family)
MTATKSFQELLKEILIGLSDSEKWLKRSYSQCQEIGIKENYSADEFDSFENLTSRFSRAVDFLINKVYRCIDHIELENTGTLIDVVNRAHKRGLIDSVEKLREIKELRNEIVHEYTSKQLKSIFDDVFNNTAMLFDLIENVRVYCEKFK